jgi:hypothetical protein
MRLSRCQYQPLELPPPPSDCRAWGRARRRKSTLHAADNGEFKPGGKSSHCLARGPQPRSTSSRESASSAQHLGIRSGFPHTPCTILGPGRKALRSKRSEGWYSRRDLLISSTARSRRHREGPSRCTMLPHPCICKNKGSSRSATGSMTTLSRNATSWARKSG